MDVDPIVRTALKEDIGSGDITTQLLFSAPYKVKAKITAQENGIVCGLDIAKLVFRLLDKKVKIVQKLKDGQTLNKGKTICILEGNAKALLTGERTALNFIGRLSGIATLTCAFVNKTKPFGAKVLDTRKTTPGLRSLEKYAVRCGGGSNHRFGLWDQVLVKDNHLSAVSKKNDLKVIVQNLRKKTKKKIEVEVQNLRELKKVLEAKPDIIMLDNMSLKDIRKAVKLTRNSRVKLEVSGGVTLHNIRAIASAGVDRISIGALTHSARSLNFSMEVI